MTRDAWEGTLLWWSCQSPLSHSCGLFSYLTSLCGRMFKLNTKFLVDLLLYLLSHFECDSHTVLMLTHASCLVQSFLVRHQITQVTQPPYSPDLEPCNFWLFPKLKQPFKGKRFQTVDDIQKIQQRSWWQLGELYEIPRCLLWRGLRCHCPVYNVSCILSLIQ